MRNTSILMYSFHNNFRDVCIIFLFVMHLPVKQTSITFYSSRSLQLLKCHTETRICKMVLEGGRQTHRSLLPVLRGRWSRRRSLANTCSFPILVCTRLRSHTAVQEHSKRPHLCGFMAPREEVSGGKGKGCSDLQGKYHIVHRTAEGGR